MKFQLEEFHRNISDDALLDDLRQAAQTLALRGASLTFRSYRDVGKFTPGTQATRFGSWNKALVAAGLQIGEEKNVTTRDLFDNLMKVWLAIGKQPVFRDMARPPSRYRASLYCERFGTWRNALQHFIDSVTEHGGDSGIDDERESLAPTSSGTASPQVRRTTRNISERLRFAVLLRDGFSCQSCGASSLSNRGVELHVDHILPWSKGGETESLNLQTKCSRCNLGKGNAFNE
jgi:hypothetical protein